MNLRRSNIHHTSPVAKSVRVLQLIAVASLLVFGTRQCLAREHALNYLAEGQIDPIALLPPPPFPNSSEQAADMDTVRSVHRDANNGDLDAANAEKKVSVFLFTSSIGGFFTATNLPKTAACFEKIQLDAAAVTDVGKSHFQRPRPYTIDKTLANGKPEKSFSYPSGHSTESMVLALVLADLLPDRRDAIVDRARSIGWHRVQAARHYPTDIYAGRVLAQAIVQQMKTNPDFQKDIAEVKAEIAAAQAVSRN